MVLGTRAGEAQAQLEGFKSRALRGEVPLRAQRQVYTAEWRVLDVQAAAGAAVAVMLGADLGHLGAYVGRDQLAQRLGAGEWDVLVADRYSNGVY